MSSHSEASSLGTYIGVFLALILLTLATVGVAFYDFGVFNPYVGIAIAVVKALLVILYFMHVRHGLHRTWVFAFAGFAWLLILISATLGDFLTR